MSFFGLTALGDQNKIRASLQQTNLLEIFTNEVFIILIFGDF